MRMTFLTTSKINQGFITEENHYQALIKQFDYVTPPKNSGVGSDFMVVRNGVRATFESKTSNTDIFDAGVLGTFSNGHIYDASNFLVNNHIVQLQGLINDNLGQLKEYLKVVKEDMFPHAIDVSVFNQAKQEGALVHMMTKEPLKNIIEQSFKKTHNLFVKANYIVVDERVYLVSSDKDMDPLGLRDRGAAILTDDCIDTVSVRTARSGARNGRTSVALRAQYRLKRVLPDTEVTLHNIVKP